jgi:AcrR family transcriptional regulator
VKNETELRKQVIIQSALKLFAKKGHGATMSDIIVDIGGSKATLYKYFPSKQALLQAVMENIAARASAISELIEGDAPIEARVHAFTRAYLDYLVDPKVINLRRFLATEAHSGLARKSYKQIVVPVWTRIARGFEKDMKRGVLRRDDPWLAAMQLQSLVDGYVPALIALGVIKRPAKPVLQKVAATSADIFLRGYSPDEPVKRARRITRSRRR